MDGDCCAVKKREMEHDTNTQDSATTIHPAMQWITICYGQTADCLSCDGCYSTRPSGNGLEVSFLSKDKVNYHLNSQLKSMGGLLLSM